MIPKVVHLTYKCKDPNKLPERCKKCYKSIQTWFGAAGYRIVFADDTDMHKAVLEYDKELFQLYQQQPIITTKPTFGDLLFYIHRGVITWTRMCFGKSLQSFFWNLVNRKTYCAKTIQWENAV